MKMKLRFILNGQAKELEAPPEKRLIDLLDGEELIDKIVECNIGIHEVRDYEIDEEYIKKI